MFVTEALHGIIGGGIASLNGTHLPNIDAVLPASAAAVRRCRAPMFHAHFPRAYLNPAMDRAKSVTFSIFVTTLRSALGLNAVSRTKPSMGSQRIAVVYSASDSSSVGKT